MINVFLVAAYASLFCLGLGDNIRGPLFPEVLSQLEITNSVGAWFFAISSLFGALGAALAAIFISKFGRHIVLSSALLCFGLGFILMGMDSSFMLMLAASAVIGASMGFLGVVQNTMVALASSENNRSRALGGLHAMYGLASFCAPLVVSFFAFFGFFWKSAFFFAGGIALVISSISFYMLPAQETELSSQHKKINRQQLWLAFALALYVLAEVMISSRMALYFRSEQKMNLEESSLMVTVFFIFLLAGRLLITRFQVINHLRLFITFLLFASAVTVYLGLYFNSWFLPFSGLFMAAIYPLSVNWFSILFKQSLDALMSWVTALQSFGLFVMHLGVGRLTDTMGLTQALLLGIVIFIISAMMIGMYGKIVFHHAARV
jgi:MFS transporter, FHS family, glucose/mannose:H+ symporter